MGIKIFVLVVDATMISGYVGRSNSKSAHSVYIETPGLPRKDDMSAQCSVSQHHELRNLDTPQSNPA